MVDVAANQWKRLALDVDNWPVERSNLKFTHKKHLVETGVLVPGQTGKRVLQCADCHQPEPGGVGMALPSGQSPARQMALGGAFF